MKIRNILLVLLLSCLTRAALAQVHTDTIAVRKLTHSTWHAAVDENGNGLYCVVWTQRGEGVSKIRALFLRQGQREEIRVFDVSAPNPGFEDSKPAVTFLNCDTAIVAWQRGGDGRQRVLYRLLAGNGQALSDEGWISDAEADAMLPALRRTPVGALAVWQDFRNLQLDIYARPMNAEGLPEGHASMLNDDGGRALQGQPKLSAGSCPAALAVWSDNRVDGKWKFYYQLWRAGPVGENVLLDSAQRKNMTTLAAAAWMSQDTAVFVWKDYREGHSNIYRRVADISRSTLTPAQRINDDDGDRWQRLPVIAGDGRGNMVMCWEDYRNTETNQQGDTYMQVFERDGSPRGGNQRVNDRDDRIPRKAPVIAMAVDGVYLIVWHQGEESSFDLVGQWFRYPDERLGENFCLTCREKKQ
ncbi:MAG: hypothetical protein M5R41_12320 [Bacteroidia bacterium]|nr:hypothetical protein [Bacteroidia bacterium]